MAFTAADLLEQLAGFPPGSRFVVAYSGGLDSTVLLHAMHHAITLADHDLMDTPAYSLRAIHVNHGLSPNANQWQKLCEQTCVHLGVPLHVERVKIDPDESASLESLAREKRYDVFERQLAPDECLLMAHHLDDQAETFLLRSFRGAGPRGLSAIPKRRPLGKGSLFRPLLAFPRKDLEDYAGQALIAWVEDESNASQLFDRNYCRHTLLPKIEERWPAYRESWQRSAQLCAEADILLDDLGALDYEIVRTPIASVVDTPKIAALSPARQRNVLRYWLSVAGAPDPGWNVLMHVVEELIPAAPGTQPEIRWHANGASVVLRRYRQNLYLQKVLENSANLVQVDWQPKELCHLKGNGLIYGLAKEGEGLRVDGDIVLNLRYRQGGETCKLHGRRTRSLKKILQDANVPPWLRERVPLVYCGDELICIPGVGITEGWNAVAGEPGWQIIWVPPDVAPKR